MCDYPLMSLPNRLARPGEELVVHRFACGVLGFASASILEARNNRLMLHIRNIWSGSRSTRRAGEAQPVQVVRVPSGARLAVFDIPESLQREIDVRRTEEATFTEIPVTPFQFRDALRFRNGRRVLLQRLPEGQRMRVLDLALSNFADEAELKFRRPMPLPMAAFRATRAFSRILFSRVALSIVTN